MGLMQKVMAMILVFMVTAAVPAVAEEKPQGPPPARIVTAPVLHQEMAETTRVVGTFYFDRISQLSAEVSGVVEKIHFREGDHVKKDTPMIRLNTDFINNEIESVQAGMAQVKVRMAKAQKDLQRYKTLFQEEAASEKEFDDMALSQEDLSKQLLILAKQLELARLKKKKSVLMAPFDGVILKKKIDLGSWVAPGVELCLLGSEKDLYIKAPVSENLFRFARKGDRVAVEVKALGQEYTGILDGAMPEADPQTKTVFVKVRMPRIEEALLNMSATVFLPAGEKKEMILVPRDALVNFNGQDMVFTVQDGKAAPMPISIISYVEAYAGVEKGALKDGMFVVVDGNERLRPGQAVTVIDQAER